MKNIPDLDAKLQTLFHSTSSIFTSFTPVFNRCLQHTRGSFLSGTYRIELWVNYSSIIEQMTSKAEWVRKFPNFGMAATLWRHMVIKSDNDPELIMQPWNQSRLQFRNHCSVSSQGCCVHFWLFSALKINVEKREKQTTKARKYPLLSVVDRHLFDTTLNFSIKC